MSTITTLASGQITPTDTITVVLVEPHEMPPSVIIQWPAAPTVADPSRYPTVAADAMKLAEASTTLAGIRARRRR